MTLLTVNQLSHAYRHQQVLSDISLTLKQGETVALLGRSGCGKSTLARLLVGLEAPEQGHICWRGTPLPKLTAAARRDFRRDVQMVFQDPISAVNPRMTVRDIVREPLRHLAKLSKAQQLQRITQLLAEVELEPDLLEKRPMQLSGGQLQRVCLARALAVAPGLLILDEAVSSLDRVVQSGIIALLQRLQQRSGAACLFITHDLRLVERFCQRVLVMEAGEIVENVTVSAPLRFSSAAGQALQQAVLPALPSLRPRNPLCNALP